MRKIDPWLLAAMVVICVGTILAIVFPTSKPYSPSPATLQNEHKRFKELVDFEEKCSIQAQKLKRWNDAEMLVDATDFPPALVQRMLESKRLMRETIDVLQQNGPPRPRQDRDGELVPLTQREFEREKERLRHERERHDKERHH